jgi:uncharacterized membrane protein YraQ (UPF0718 family)
MRTMRGVVFSVVLLIVVFIAKGYSAQLSPELVPPELRDGFTLAFSVLIESIPFIILGIALSVLVQVWLPDQWLFRILPSRPLPRRFVISLLGMFLPVCECGNVPLARGLVAKGYSVSDSMTFLIAAPIINPVTIITTHQAFGWDNGILVARILGAIVIANILGWLFSKHSEPFSLLTPRFAAQCERPDETASTGRVARSADMFAREAAVLMPALIVGSLVAGAIQVLVSRDQLVALGSDPFLSVIAMMVLAFVISICANVDSFFILPFADTFLPGSLVAFLLLGPIVDIKMLALMRTTYRSSTLLRLTALVVAMTAAIGMGVNLVA